jgi:hypothetical protein
MLLSLQKRIKLGEDEMGKKILALILSVTLMGSMLLLTSNVFAEDTAYALAEEAAVALLTDIGIFTTNDSVNVSTDVTRGLAAVSITRLLGIGDITTGTETKFSDVPVSHNYSGAIVALDNLGIMKGFGDGTFHPDDMITYNQLVKVLVASLGYSVHAESLGGYPEGYLIKATQLGLLKGADKTGEATLKAGAMARLIENALDTKIISGSRIQVGGYEKYSEGGTLAAEYLGLEKIKGQITGTYYTSFKIERPLLKGEVALDGVPVNVGLTKVEQYFGMNVTAYIQTQEYTDERVLLSVVPDAKNLTYEFEADQISPASTTATSLTYFDENDKQRSVGISSGAVLINNGTFEDRAIVSSDFDITDGVIKLIAPNGSEAAVVIIDSYVNGIVDVVDTEEAVVYFKNPVYGVKSLEIDVDDTSVKTTVVNPEGLPMSIGEFSEFDVISIVRGVASLKAIWSNNKIRGVVKELGKDTVIIEETTYGVATNLLDTTNDLEKLEIGLEAIFNTDYTGKIAVIAKKADSGDNAKRYGYIVSGIITEGLSSKPQIKVFTEDGEWKVFEFTDKIRFNGAQGVSATDIFNLSSPLITGGINREDIVAMNTNFESLPTKVEDRFVKADQDYINYKEAHNATGVYEQLIRYKLNSSGLVTELETALSGPELSVQERNERFSRDNDMDINANNSSDKSVIKRVARFLAGPSYMFGTQYFLRSNTKIFVVPDMYDGANDDLYEIKPHTALKHSQSGQMDTWVFDLRLYDVDEKTRIASAMVDRKQGLSGMVAEVSNYADIGIVTDIAKGMNDEGADMFVVSVYKRSGGIDKLYAEADQKIGFNFSFRFGVLTDRAK